MLSSGQLRKSDLCSRYVLISHSTHSPSTGYNFVMYRWRWAILKALPLGVLLPMTLFFGSVGPDDFAKNYAAWARKWGLTDWADWLGTYATGPRVFWVTTLLSVIYLVVVFGLPALIKRTPSNIAAFAVPIIVAILMLLGTYGLYLSTTPGERHITEDQRVQLKETLAPLLPTLSTQILVCSADNPEASNYAVELMAALTQAGLKIHSMSSEMAIPCPIRVLTPKLTGVAFLVSNPNDPPSEVRTLTWALASAGIRAGSWEHK
jgi:hypothetical protein